jgi:hypothetical protein
MEYSSEQMIEDVEVEEVQPELNIEPGQDSPVLSVKEAALILGKSIRALERSLSGKWGNKLPEGWSASKKIIDGSEEWQIYPPEGFRCEHLLESLRRPTDDPQMQRIQLDDLLRPVRQQFDHATGNEITSILKELAQAHRELADQRKLHMQDLRTLLELQGSMRLLEANSGETAKLRGELVEAQKDLIALRDRYKMMLSLPWWKRIFIKGLG